MRCNSHEFNKFVNLNSHTYADTSAGNSIALLQYSSLDNCFASLHEILSVRGIRTRAQTHALIRNSIMRR